MNVTMQPSVMPLNLYRRHFRIPGKCVGGYEPDFRNYETDELRRGWKKCHCPIYADGTLGGKFKRRNTKKTNWREAKEVVAAWEVAGAWGAPDAAIAVPDRAPEPPEAEASRPSITIQFATDAYLA